MSDMPDVVWVFEGMNKLCANKEYLEGFNMKPYLLLEAVAEKMKKRKATEWCIKNEDGSSNMDLVRHNKVIDEMIILLHEMAGEK